MSQKIALVSGASKGIGAACARALARDGYQVAIHYRSDPSSAQALQAELAGSELFCFDVSEPQACQELVQAVKARWGRLDVLVNNAGIAIDQILPFAKPEDFDRLLATNLKSVFLLSKHSSRLMIKQKHGVIINITSVVGHSGNGGQCMYAATKSAVTGFTKSIALDLAPYHIRCNCVAPGFIKTAMTEALPKEVQESILSQIPLKRLGLAEEVGEAVAFLASEKASYITGTSLHVNGGLYR